MTPRAAVKGEQSLVLRQQHSGFRSVRQIQKFLVVWIAAPARGRRSQRKWYGPCLPATQTIEQSVACGEAGTKPRTLQNERQFRVGLLATRGHPTR